MACQAGVHFFTVRAPESAPAATGLLGEVKMTREEVEAIVRDTTLFGWSNLWLESYYRHLKVVPKRPKQPAGPTPRLVKAK
jgi:hypothetical protein